MSTAARRILALAFPLALVPFAAAPAQEPAPEQQPREALEDEVEVTTAEPETLARLLAIHESALESDDADEIAAALAPMSVHDNPELAEVAIDALEYRASRLDEKAAKALGEELGTTSRKEIEALVAAREAAVQEAAAYVLANFPEDRKVLRALQRAFRDRDIQRDKPVVVAALIRAFGRIGHGDVEDDVVSELRKGPAKEVARAAVRYLGELPTRDYDVVRMLCEMLDAPEPASVDSPTNPPASYWQNRWETWSWTRRDVTWALQRITGQVFRPAEGDHPSDAREALEYVEAHKDELGLR